MKAMISLLWLGLMLGAGLARAAQPLPAASWTHLPPWRGFNLPNRFMLGWNPGPFRESDFQFLAEHGFNCVRAPMDYRTYIVGTNWEAFSESAPAGVDEAVAFGGKQNVHVCLNLHRIPGWTVASPAESRSLWTDPEAQRVTVLHRGGCEARIPLGLANPWSVCRGHDTSDPGAAGVA